MARWLLVSRYFIDINMIIGIWHRGSARFACVRSRVESPECPFPWVDEDYICVIPMLVRPLGTYGGI